MQTPLQSLHTLIIQTNGYHRARGRNPFGVGDPIRSGIPEVAAWCRNLGLWDKIPLGFQERPSDQMQFVVHSYDLRMAPADSGFMAASLARRLLGIETVEI